MLLWLSIIYFHADLIRSQCAAMESPVLNLHNLFQKLRAQVDGLNDSIEPRKLSLLSCLYVQYVSVCVDPMWLTVVLYFATLLKYVL